MCAQLDYYASLMYYPFLGLPTEQARERVRLYRKLAKTHRSRCAECRGIGRTNYNLKAGQTRFYKPKEA